MINGPFAPVSVIEAGQTPARKRTSRTWQVALVPSHSQRRVNYRRRRRSAWSLYVVAVEGRARWAVPPANPVRQRGSSEEIAKMQSLCVFGGLAVPAGVCAWLT